MSRKQITLPLENLSVGGMVTELVRAYLYTGNPSALLSRLSDGVKKHMDEVWASANNSDRHILGALKNALDAEQQRLQELEDKTL